MDYATFYQEMNTKYYRADCYHTMENPDNDATSGNHHVINATYHLISSKLGGYTDNVQLSRDFVRELRFLQTCQGPEPGLIARHPTKLNDPQTHDDYIGIEVSSKLLGLTAYPNDIEEYGKNHHWYYDNLQKPITLSTTWKELGAKWNYWHGKFFGQVGVYRRAAGKSISLLDRLGFCATLLSDIYFTKDRTDVSGKILLWLKVSVMKGESPMVDRCINKWEDYIRKTYPEGQMGQVLGIYHGVHHPFAQAMWGKM